MATSAHLKPWDWAVLVILGLATALALAALPPIPQDPAYHRFADRRMLLGIPNIWNVVSNLPFALVGLYGLAQCMKTTVPGGLTALRAHYVLFFIAAAGVSAGSAWYHWQPTTESLVWDRLPITIAFMAIFVAMIGECISVPLARWLLVPLLLAGLAALGQWHFTERAGTGDLRLYALVQILPLALIPLMLWRFGSRLRPTGYIWAMLASYGLAKAAEFWDSLIMAAVGVSGHTIKHLLAALAIYWFALALRRRSYKARVIF